MANGRGQPERSSVLRAPWEVLLPSVHYIFQTEVHAYAFSIAANAFLSFFPFNLFLLVVCGRWLQWRGAYQMVLQLLRVHLPSGTESVVQNLMIVANGRARLQVASLFMLIFTSSGIFLPLEIALNKIWGFRRNRTFLKNQAVSFALALASVVMSLVFILAMSHLQVVVNIVIGWIPSRSLLSIVSRAVLEIASVPLLASIFFMIYYFLPNGKVPVTRVFPAAVATGILTELGMVVYSLTLPLFRFRDVYGPFALSVTLLFWAYAGAMMLLFGAHLSAHKFVPEEILEADRALVVGG